MVAFRGERRGRGRGRGGGGGGNYGRGGGGRGGFGRNGVNLHQGPPNHVVPFGHYAYSCMEDLVCKADIEEVPYFNAPIYLENKTQIGKVDEVFGTIRSYSVTVKLMENMKANSFKANQALFIEPTRLLPLSRFLPKPPQPKTKKKKSAGGGGGFGNQRHGKRNFSDRSGDKFGNGVLLICYNLEKQSSSNSLYLRVSNQINDITRLCFEDEDFVFRITSDIEYFIEERNDNDVLLFPPVNNYRRFLIHKICQAIGGKYRLHTFSVGEHDFRRTVVCLKDQLLNMQNESNVKPNASNKSLGQISSKNIRHFDGKPFSKFYNKPPKFVKQYSETTLDIPETECVETETLNCKRGNKSKSMVLYKPPALRNPYHPSVKSQENCDIISDAMTTSIEQDGQEQPKRGGRQKRRPDRAVYIPKGRRTQIGHPNRSSDITTVESSTSEIVQTSNYLQNESLQESITLSTSDEFAAKNCNLSADITRPLVDKDVSSYVNFIDEEIQGWNDEVHTKSIKTNTNVPFNVSKRKTIEYIKDINAKSKKQGQQQSKPQNLFLDNHLETRNITDEMRLGCSATDIDREILINEVINNELHTQHLLRTTSADQTPAEYIPKSCELSGSTVASYGNYEIHLVNKTKNYNKCHQSFGNKSIDEKQQTNYSHSTITEYVKNEEDILAVNDLDESEEADSVLTNKKDNVDRISDNDWDAMYDENGDCIDRNIIAELTDAVGKVEIVVPKLDYSMFTTKLDNSQFPHVLEVSNFPPEFTHNDLLMVFANYKESGFDIKWVDDTHALVIFSSSTVAAEVLNMRHPFIILKPLMEASYESRLKAKKCSNYLLPYRQRPQTCPALARRLVTGALGLRLKTGIEEREKEQSILRQAKENKLQAAKLREKAWNN